MLRYAALQHSHPQSTCLKMTFRACLSSSLPPESFLHPLILSNLTLRLTRQPPLLRPAKRLPLARVHRIRLLLTQPCRIRIELPLHLRGLLLEIRLPVQLALLRRGQGHGVLVDGGARGGTGLVGRGQGGGLGCQGAGGWLGATLGFCGF